MESGEIHEIFLLPISKFQAIVHRIIIEKDAVIIDPARLLKTSPECALQNR